MVEEDSAIRLRGGLQGDGGNRREGGPWVTQAGVSIQPPEPGCPLPFSFLPMQRRPGPTQEGSGPTWAGKGQTQLDIAACGRPRTPELRALVRCVHAQGWMVCTAEGSLGWWARLALWSSATWADKRKRMGWGAGNTSLVTRAGQGRTGAPVQKKARPTAVVWEQVLKSPHQSRRDFQVVGPCQVQG